MWNSGTLLKPEYSSFCSFIWCENKHLWVSTYVYCLKYSNTLSDNHFSGNLCGRTCFICFWKEQALFNLFVLSKAVLCVGWSWSMLYYLEGQPFIDHISGLKMKQISIYIIYLPVMKYGVMSLNPWLYFVISTVLYPPAYPRCRKISNDLTDMCKMWTFKTGEWQKKNRNLLIIY